MGRHSRKDHRPNPEKWAGKWQRAFMQEVETPQGKHVFAILPSMALYWVTPEGPWRKVAEDATK